MVTADLDDIAHQRVLLYSELYLQKISLPETMF